MDDRRWGSKRVQRLDRARDCIEWRQSREGESAQTERYRPHPHSSRFYLISSQFPQIFHCFAQSSSQNVNILCLSLLLFCILMNFPNFSFSAFPPSFALLNSFAPLTPILSFAFWEAFHVIFAIQNRYTNSSFDDREGGSAKSYSFIAKGWFKNKRDFGRDKYFANNLCRWIRKSRIYEVLID